MRIQLRSKDRVRDLAEVFTAEREVDQMLDLVGSICFNPGATFLEPSCGNGNFLVKILSRKLRGLFVTGIRQRDLEFTILQSISTTYGIDICHDNVAEARERLRMELVELYSTKFNTLEPNRGFWSAVDFILETNIQQGDMLNGVDVINIVEFSTPKPYHFAMTVWRLSDLGAKSKKDSAIRPLQRYPSVPYLKLGEGNAA